MKFKHTYILLIAALVFISCKQTKYVPEGQFLLKKNEVVLDKKQLSKDDLESIIRQQPNYKRIGIKWKLFAYNRFDSLKIANKRQRLNKRLAAKNVKRGLKEDRINKKRIEKAREKGKTDYSKKLITPKDTVSPRKFLREWYKYKIGRPPVIFDSTLFEKSQEQLLAYMKKRGYYYGSVAGFIDYKKNGKCIVSYHLEEGEKYIIDSVYIISDIELVTEKYNLFLNNGENKSILKQAFDSELLEDYRIDISTFMRNEGLYGFSPNHIKFLADTTKATSSVQLGIQFSDRYIKSKEVKDSIIRKRQQEAYISNVYFHIIDTLHFEGSFQDEIDRLGLNISDGQFLRTINITEFTYEKKRKSKRVRNRMAFFMHNGELQVKPRVLEVQNYLKKGSLYSEKKLEQTYLSLLRMDLYQAVKTELVETDSAGQIEAHYYLVPSKKQTFGFEPRATNSNGFLGVAATINYVNRNLFKGAQKLTLSLSGGFESQPPVFDETLDGDKIEAASRSFNTFEFGPSLKLELPALFPFKMTKRSKNFRPRTIISSAYNYQKRDDFVRGTFQLNYDYSFSNKKTMRFDIGLPGASVIKFVSITKTMEFQDRLEALNDLFLINAYSNQFVWQDLNLTFEFNSNKKERRKGNGQIFYKASLDAAGNILSLFQNSQDTVGNGQFGFVGVGYSQFLRMDNELILAKPVGADGSINFRAILGAGLPYGNTTTSLPYDYSFFAGGANDNRGWRARSLGPGAYKYYLDTNRTATQIGDIRLGSSIEYRFAFSSLVKGGLFIDAGNVWSIFEDKNRIGGQFSKNWFNEIALAAGFGLRFDLDYFIVRVDIGFPIKNPALPKEAQWVFNSRKAYHDEGLAKFGTDYKSFLPLPFIPAFHFGIGYPF